MILQKLTKENWKQISGKRICCVEASYSYLEEFCDTYNALNSIKVIIDNNEKKQGMLCLQGHDIPVCAIGHLQEIVTKDASKEWEIIITGDYYREHFEMLVNLSEVSDLVETVYYFPNKEIAYEEEFRDLYKDCALEDIIIFRSGPHITSYIKGMDFSDNARALFEYMLAEGYNQKYELVWLVKNPDEFVCYEKYENVRFLPLEWSVSDKREERQQYYRTLCLAKFIFFTDAYGIARNCREDQVRVQLWHGCGFKTRLNFQPCEKRYEYTTVSSDLYAKIHSEVFGLKAEQMLVTGYPKQDWLFKACDRDFRKELNLPKAKNYIYWLPTYRQATDVLSQTNGYEVNPQTGLPMVDTKDKMYVLNELLCKDDSVMIIKLHPFQKVENISKFNLSNIVLLDNSQLLEKDIQINQLLSMADALISDYSSVAVDYALLDRPMAFLLDDVEEYENARGFVLENIRDYLPGKEVYSFEELCEFIKEIGEGQDSSNKKRKSLLNVLNKYGDGNSSKRILRALGIEK